MIHRRAAPGSWTFPGSSRAESPSSGDRVAIRPVLAELEGSLAVVLAQAIAADAAVHPAPGLLLRAVARWTDPLDPGAITLHLLGTGDDPRGASGDDVRWPLEWANADRELRRVDRIRGVPEVALLLDTLALRYRSAPREAGDGVARPLQAAMRLLEDALVSHGIELADTFAVRTVRADG